MWKYFCCTGTNDTHSFGRLVSGGCLSVICQGQNQTVGNNRSPVLTLEEPPHTNKQTHTHTHTANLRLETLSLSFWSQRVNTDICNGAEFVPLLFVHLSRSSCTRVMAQNKWSAMYFQLLRAFNGAAQIPASIDYPPRFNSLSIINDYPAVSQSGVVWLNGMALWGRVWQRLVFHPAAMSLKHINGIPVKRQS